MKKLVFLFLILSLVGIAPLMADIRVGGYGLNQFALGDYADYALCTAGGGAVLEAAVPLPFLRNFGLSLRAQGNWVFPQVESLSSYYNAAALAGAWLRIPISPGIYFQPEFAYGVWLHSLTKKEGYSGEDGLFVDQALQVQANISFSFAQEKFTLAFGPTYTILFEDAGAPMLFGVNLAFLYSL